MGKQEIGKKHDEQRGSGVSGRVHGFLDCLSFGTLMQSEPARLGTERATVAWGLTSSARACWHRQRLSIWRLAAAIRVATGAAGDAASSITCAELAATFYIARLGTKLGSVKSGEESAAADLAGDGGEGVLGGFGAGAGVLGRVGYTSAGAAVRVTHQGAAELILGDVVEIEQITAGVAATLSPDATTLH